MSLHAIDHLGTDRAHMIAHVRYPHRLEQCNEALRFHAQIASYLVHTQLCRHPTSVTLCARPGSSSSDNEIILLTSRERSGENKATSPSSSRPKAAPSSALVLNRQTRPPAARRLTGDSSAEARASRARTRSSTWPSRSASSTAVAPRPASLLRWAACSNDSERRAAA